MEAHRQPSRLGRERRAASRADACWPALFRADPRAQGMLHSGTAEGVSAHGLRVYTRARPDPGLPLDIELHPPGSAPMLASGTVIRLDADARGPYIAVRLAAGPMPAPGPPIAANVQHGPRKPAPSVKPPEQRSKTRDTPSRIRQSAPIMALAVLLALLLFLVQDLREDALDATAHAAQTSAPLDHFAGTMELEEPVMPEILDAAAELQDPEPGAELPEASGAEAPDSSHLAALQPAARFEALPAIAFPGILAGLPAMPSSPGHPGGPGAPAPQHPVETHSTAPAPDTPALESAASPEDLGASLHVAYAAAVGNHMLADAGVPDWDGSLPHTAPHGASETTAHGAAAELRIEIHKRERLLWVFDGARPLAALPVGLGAEGSTPEGRFHIANKLEDPYWYNRGDPIPPGDPRNPLGRYWIGLGDAHGATPYGLHAAQDPAAIGNDTSRGCVHLRPEDAAYLFGLCPTGTEVEILP